MEKFDLIVIGAGPGGYGAALHAAKRGLRTALIEKNQIGGTCLNVGCIPTKAIVTSAAILGNVKRGGDFGVTASDVKIDFGKILSRKDEVVTKLREGVKFLLKKEGVTVIEGSAKFTGEKRIEVELTGGGKAGVEAEKIILATGSSPAELRSIPFDGEKIISSTEALRLESIPKKLLIVGAGYIGLEFAYIFSALGTEVHVVEVLEQILAGESRELAKRLEVSLKKNGVKFHLKTSAESPEKTGSAVKVKLSSGETIETDKVLVSVGRKRNTAGLGLEEIGVKLEDGAVQVDEYLETTVKGIYAVGDVLKSPQLAHVATREGIVAVENILGKYQKINYLSSPNVIYTRPEVARVGINEEEAKEKGIGVKTAKMPFTAIGKAHCSGDTKGYVKLVADEKTGVVLGGEIIGNHAGDLIAEVAVAVKNRLNALDVAETIHAHPTLSEAVMETAYSLL